MKVIKTDVKGFVKDPKSKAVLASDDEYLAFQAERKRKRQERTLQEQINSLKNEISALKHEVMELKNKHG